MPMNIFHRLILKIAIIDIMYSFQFEFFFYILNFKTQHALNALLSCAWNRNLWNGNSFFFGDDLILKAF